MIKSNWWFYCYKRPKISAICPKDGLSDHFEKKLPRCIKSTELDKIPLASDNTIYLPPFRSGLATADRCEIIQDELEASNMLSQCQENPDSKDGLMSDAAYEGRSNVQMALRWEKGLEWWTWTFSQASRENAFDSGRFSGDWCLEQFQAALTPSWFPHRKNYGVWPSKLTDHFVHCDNNSHIYSDCW